MLKAQILCPLSPAGSNGQPDLDEEEWCPNLQFDSSKPDWDASDTEDEPDFLDKAEKRPGVNVRKYRNNGLYVALMRTAIQAGDDLRDEEWVPKDARKKL